MKRIITLQELYTDLHYIKPALVGSVSLRMVELTMNERGCSYRSSRICFLWRDISLDWENR